MTCWKIGIIYLGIVLRQWSIKKKYIEERYAPLDEAAFKLSSPCLALSLLSQKKEKKLKCTCFKKMPWSKSYKYLLLTYIRLPGS
jgi:hypothetical protein